MSSFNVVFQLPFTLCREFTMVTREHNSVVFALNMKRDEAQNIVHLHVQHPLELSWAGTT